MTQNAGVHEAAQQWFICSIPGSLLPTMIIPSDHQPCKVQQTTVQFHWYFETEIQNRAIRFTLWLATQDCWMSLPASADHSDASASSPHPKGMSAKVSNFLLVTSWRFIDAAAFD